MQPENATKDVVPTNNEDFSMFDTDTAGECDKNCKKPCMNVVTGLETYDMSLDSCDMFGLEDMEMQLPIVPCPDMEVFLLHDETPQDVQQLIDPSTWEMDLVEAYADMSMSVPVTPVTPAFVWPHGGSFLPPTESEQEQDEEPHRPREPFAAVDYPQPIVQSYEPPPWYGEPFLFDEGIDVSNAGKDQGVSMKPLDHEQWASPGISPMSMEQDAVPEMNLTVDLGTLILSDSGYGTYHHSVDGDHQSPTSAGEEDADWDNVPYQGIPLQVLCTPVATLLELNKSFRDLIELQWPEVMEIMFNLRFPEDGEEDAEWEWEEEQRKRKTLQWKMPKKTLQQAIPMKTTLRQVTPMKKSTRMMMIDDDDDDDDDDDYDLEDCDPKNSDPDASMSFVSEDEEDDDMDMDYEP
ncbi:hypothetical protein PG997_002059 [Apiospora hydei]|uniref:Uncharacterized protein n=1 Tax=Apiospora hydei TaxID=1337664 RepID=A0ABR1X8K5_9PEZI